MARFNVIGAVAALGILGGCAYSDIETLRTVEAVGSPFSQALTEEYRQIVAFEADEMYDWIDAGYFAQKGLRAAGGEEVAPELVEDWAVSGAEAEELAGARAQLVSLLDAGGRSVAPDIAAHAQGRFDCWIEQQEEGWQLDHIAACRDEFYKALADLEAALGGSAADAYTVYFAFDSSALTAAAQAEVDKAVAAAAKAGVNEFSVTGHTDTSGSNDYNLALSLRRANSVKDALIARGVPADNVSVAGRGESELAVPTGDGVREQANRRAVIVVQ